MTALSERMKSIYFRPWIPWKKDDPRRAIIFRLRGEGQTLARIGLRMGLSYERVRQLYVFESVRLERQPYSDKDLAAYMEQR